MLKAKKLRVNVVSLYKKLEVILKMLVDTRVISKYRSVFKGKGLEFEDYRAYTTQDDSSRIDWKASARAGQLLVKLFREERELDVYILLDTSSSMIFGSTEKLKMEYAAEIAAAFAYLIINAGDKAGLMMFNDKIAKIVPAAVGKKHFQLILNALVKPSFYGGGYDLKKVIDFTMKICKKRGLMIIISDFIDIEEGWEDILKLASVKFDIIGVMVKDPRDRFMPEEQVSQIVLQDPYSNASLLLDPKKISKEYEEHVKKEEQHLVEAFLRCKADMIDVCTDKSFIKPLIEYFIMRKARITRHGF